jgi:prevent-host-death family protein
MELLMNVPVAEAKAKFSELVKRAEAGEEVLVTRHGKVVARLVPPAGATAEKRPLLGAFEDKAFWMADDFDELGPEWDEYTR